MTRSSVGWMWVAGQVVLLGALIVLPGSNDWSTPDWILFAAAVLFFTGLAIVAIAALGLGAALTPTPVPTKRGSLITTGFYKHVRHPIYTGVAAIVAGMTLRSGSWLHAVIALITLAFFDRKAAWEEQQLCEQYPDYPHYASLTPKFIPQPWRTLRASFDSRL